MNNAEKEIKTIKVLNMKKNKIMENTLNFYYEIVKFNEIKSVFNLKYFEEKDFKIIDKNYETNLLGEHNILNEVLAIAVGKQFGLEDTYIENALKNIKLTDMRFQKVEIENKIYINDAYNASPSSMKKSLETFSKIFNDIEKIIVLGDMLELGEKEIEYHENLLNDIQKAQINKVYLFGNRMEALYKKLLEQKEIDGIKQKEIIYFENKQDIINKINESNNKKVILVKASRGIKLEEIIK